MPRDGTSKSGGAGGGGSGGSGRGASSPAKAAGRGCGGLFVGPGDPGAGLIIRPARSNRRPPLAVYRTDLTENR